MKALESPNDLAVEQTLGFVQANLGRKHARILEVGCGDGSLALRLVALGHDVTGIDRSSRAVELAKKAGFEPKLGDFLDFHADPFDAIAFTRSLHHIHDLRRALDHAHSLLVPGGTCIIDDFALERMDKKTARWLADLRSVLVAANLLHSHDRPTDPLEAWRKEHEHDPPLHPGKALVATIRKVFKGATSERVPYLYRYFCHGLEPTPTGLAVAKTILEAETRLLGERALVPIGLRILATRSRSK